MATCTLNRDGSSGSWQTRVLGFGVNAPERATPTPTPVEAESCKKALTSALYILYHRPRGDRRTRQSQTRLIEVKHLAPNCRRHVSSYRHPRGIDVSQHILPSSMSAPEMVSGVPFRWCARALSSFMTSESTHSLSIRPLEAFQIQ